MLFGLFFVYLACLSPSAGAAASDPLAQVYAKVVPLIQRRNGTLWIPVEVDACPADPRNNRGGCMVQTPVRDMSQLTWYHLLFSMPGRTSPYIDVTYNAVNDSVVVLDIFSPPYMEDMPRSLPYKPADYDNVTLIIAYALAQRFGNAPGIWALNVRWPVVPCLTEAVYIFNFNNGTQWGYWFVGTTSGKVCYTSTTNPVPSNPNCQGPDWSPKCLN